MNWIILVLVLVIFVGAVGWFFSREHDVQSIDPPTQEWPVLARTGERNEAYMIKALLDDANIEAIVEEDTTLGILYGVQNITDYPIRVSPEDRNQARGILRESSFGRYLEDRS